MPRRLDVPTLEETPATLIAASGHIRIERLDPRQVHHAPLERVRGPQPIDRIAQDHDDAWSIEDLPDAGYESRPAVAVRGCGLHRISLSVTVSEIPLVLGRGWQGAAVPTQGGEEAHFLLGGGADLRVLGKVGEQGTGPCFGDPHDQQVRKSSVGLSA